MRHRTVFVYRRRDGLATLHWKRGCPLGIGGSVDRLTAVERMDPAFSHLADARPEFVLDAIAETFGADFCGHCVPLPVLAALGLELPVGLRCGEPRR